MTVFKLKEHKTFIIKRKVNFGNYKICSELIQLQNKINYIKKYEISIDSIKENYTEFIKNKTLRLKIQQRFKIERQFVFTEEINKIDLISSTDDKRMQSIDLIETYAYGTSKDVPSEKEVITCNNIIKRYKNE